MKHHKMEAIAKHDFNATADDELSFRKGQVLKVSNFFKLCYFMLNHFHSVTFTFFMYLSEIKWYSVVTLLFLCCKFANEQFKVENIYVYCYSIE